MSVVDKNENRIQFVIIVVAYNAGDKLRFTLDSIYGQQYHNYHVIIKDGLSTDGSLTQLKEEKYFDNKPGKTDIFSDKDKGMHHGYASSLNGDLSSSFSDLFSGLTGVNYMETNQVHLRSLCGEKAVIVNLNE